MLPESLLRWYRTSPSGENPSHDLAEKNVSHTRFCTPHRLLGCWLTTPQLRADLYTGGDHVMHLDSDAILVEDITYSHIFYLGRPVLPFRRFRSETFEGERECGMDQSVGKEINMFAGEPRVAQLNPQ